MIPKAHIVEWRSVAQWVSDAQVEQDLIISRAMVAIFGTANLVDELAFRGGTAIHKLYIQPPRRYSEDIDLVQIRPGPIGKVIDELRKTLNPLTLMYRMESEGPPAVPLRLKIEINTREHSIKTCRTRWNIKGF